MPPRHYDMEAEVAKTSIEADLPGSEETLANTTHKPPRVGHTKSRKGCAQCKRRHVKCNEEKPCSNCVRHGVACSLAGGPIVTREDAKRPRRPSDASTSSTSRSISRKTTDQSSSTSPFRVPFAVLTQQMERPSNETELRGFGALDIELMHHYMMHTRSVVPGDKDIIYIWQEATPKSAFAHEYVLHALLGLTALHKAYVEPERSHLLRMLAVDHFDKAFIFYREKTGPLTAENAEARFIFTWFAAFFAFGVPPIVAPIDGMVELILLIRGVDLIVSETWQWVVKGPFAALFARNIKHGVTAPPEAYRVLEGIDLGLGHLDYMISLDAMVPEDRKTCIVVLGELKEIYDGALRQPGSGSVGFILSFPKRDSSEFAALVKRRLPQALIILAYYCVALDVLNTRWWMNGWPARVMSDIATALPEQWLQWIEWPTQCVLGRPHAPVKANTWMV